MEQNIEPVQPEQKETVNVKSGKKFLSVRNIVIGVAILLVLGAAGTFTYISLTTKWVAKIDNKKITLQDFNNLYYAQIRMMVDKTNDEIDKMAKDPTWLQKLPILNKEEFLNQLIQNRLLFYKAKEEGYLDNAEAKILSGYQVESIVSRFYLASALKGSTSVSDKEVADAYTQYKAQFNGVPIETAYERIRSELSQRKISVEQERKRQELDDNAKIERNEDIITRLADPDKSKRPSSGNIVTISGKGISSRTISVKEFVTGYYAQLKFIYKKTNDEIDALAADPAAVEQNPLLNRKNFLDQIIYQYLFYEAARNEGLTKKGDLSSLIDFSNEQAIVIYYVRDKFAKDIAVTDDEIAVEYDKARSQLPANILPETAEMYIRQNIEQQKLLKKTQEVVADLRERAVIEKNLNLIKK